MPINFRKSQRIRNILFASASITDSITLDCAKKFDVAETRQMQLRHDSNQPLIFPPRKVLALRLVNKPHLVEGRAVSNRAYQPSMCPREARSVALPRRFTHDDKIVCAFASPVSYSFCLKFLYVQLGWRRPQDLYIPAAVYTVQWRRKHCARFEYLQKRESKCRGLHDFVEGVVLILRRVVPTINEIRR